MALARALDVTVLELVGGTNAQSALSEWVSREDHENLQISLSDAKRELVSAKTQADGCAAHADALQRELDRLAGERAELEEKLGALEAQANRARELARQRDALDLEVRSTRSALAKSQQLVSTVVQSRDEAVRQAFANWQAWDAARRQLESLKAETAKAKNGHIATLAIGGLLGAVLASPAKRPRRRG